MVRYLYELEVMHMQVKLVKNDNLTYDIKLIDGSKNLTIMYGGNGDLYWSLVNDDWVSFYEGITNHFDITKENYEVYKSFESLLLYLKAISIREELTNYNKLYDVKSNEVTWISDKLIEEVANEVTISKQSEVIRLSFKTKPWVLGYDRNYFEFGMISIRFRNSGSRYRPFKLIFMNLFNELQKLIVNDLGCTKQLTHQK